MTGLDIFLIIVGIFLIVVSYKISENVSSTGVNKNDNVKEVWSNKEENTIKERVQFLLANKSEDIVYQTEDKLCHLSNEKIMEFEDYSNQILAKIDENHKKTVFLYNMLNEKQKEMKQWITQVNKQYTIIKNEINKYEGAKADEADEHDESVNSIPAEEKIATTENVKEIKEDNVPDIIEEPTVKETFDNVGINKQVSDDVDEETAVIDNNISDAVTEEVAIDNVVTDNVVADNPEVEKQQKQTSEDDGVDRNARILSLWNDGKSILEISKSLGIGQGEVKLVIDLYKGA